MPLTISRSLLAVALRCSIALALFSGAAAAEAETETFSSTAGLLGPTGQPDAISFPTFDTNLGTLEGIVISLKFNICPTVTFDNTTSAALAYNNVGVTAPFSVSGPGNSLTFKGTLSTRTLSGTAAPGISTLNLENDVKWIYAVKSVSTNNFGLWENQSGNTASLVVTPGNLLTIGDATLPAGLSASSTSLEWENISVQYKYLSTAAVPEPSGKYLSLIVATFMVSAFLGRRFRFGA